MDTILITLEELHQTSTAIRNDNKNLNACLKEIHTIMQQLETYWSSPSSTALRNRFQTMLPIFDNYHNIVESYAQFLDQTAQAYQQMEQQLEKNADIL